MAMFFSRPALGIALGALVLTGIAPLAVAAELPRILQNFDQGWRFFKGDTEGAQKAGFDDSSWRQLDLPHDWSIEGPFDPKDPSGVPGGYLPCGTGWYRKVFRLPVEPAAQLASIRFDGVYMNGEVWINGHLLGKRPNGHIGFEYDLTPFLKPGADNLLAVRADNSQQPSSRWYTGSGIYRHVWLTLTDKLRVAPQGIRISTPRISPSAAEVAIHTELVNGNDSGQSVTVIQTILDPNGKTVGTSSQVAELKPGETLALDQTIEIAKPALWSPESPGLHVVRTEVRGAKTLFDQCETSFGVREIRFDPDKGFFLNGKSMKMQGVCNHDDLGPLGTALWDAALERRMRMLKEMGCNAIRTAHNPPAPELLDLCDRMGFLVVNETFDKWRLGWGFEDGMLVAGRTNGAKVKAGYHLYMDEWVERDLTDHIRRDFNHPSVIMWSVGNELPEAQKHGELETIQKLRDICHKLDPSRPMTVGLNQISGVNETGFAEFLDTVGYNGGGGSVFQYEADHIKFPKRIIYASEVPHSLQTRGEYRTRTRFREKERQPSDLTEKEVFPETNDKYESSYDNAAVRINSRDSWRLTKKFPFVAGEFRWTGFDYIGESGGWPRVLGNFGIIDLCNFPKDTYYFYQSQWTDKPMAHLLPHWTWPGKEGISIPVICYTNCDSAELFLNGESRGVRKFTPESDMNLEWLVPYQPGELKVVATRDGKIAATSVIRTAGEAARIALSADQPTIAAGGTELSYVTIRIEDKDGNFAPKAAAKVSLKIEGPGRLLGVGSGDPLSHESFQGDSVTTFNGLALAIIGSTGGSGEIGLTARADGMEPVVVRISAGAGE